VLADELQGEVALCNLTRLADLLATLPRADRRRFNREWRYVREVIGLADQAIRRPVPGLDRAEQVELMLAFATWRLRLIRRTIRRARTGQAKEEIAS
jgi:hypothetical protein